MGRGLRIAAAEGDRGRGHRGGGGVDAIGDRETMGNVHLDSVEDRRVGS